MLTKILLTLGLIAIIGCEALEQCPDKKIVKKDFIYEKFGGTWYEVSRFGDKNSKQDLNCVRITYDIFFESVYIVTNSSIVDGKLQTRKGRTEIFGKDKRGILKTQYKGTNIWEESWILDTNFDSYSLVYVCNNDSSTNKIISSSIMSKNPTLSSEDRETLKKFVTKHSDETGLEWEKYESIDQDENICTSKSCASTSMASFVVTFIFILIAFKINW